jgi:hypothetical protein
VRTTLLVIGASLELVGIVLVGSPDLFPYAQRFSDWLEPRFWRLANPVLRWLGRPRRTNVVQVGAVAEASAAGHAGKLMTVKDGATLEEKVGFLLNRVTELQQDRNSIEERLTSVEREAHEQLATATEEMKGHVATELTAAHAAYLPARILGVVGLIVGLALATWANFLSP